MLHKNHVSKPGWLKVRVPGSESYFRLKALVDKQ